MITSRSVKSANQNSASAFKTLVLLLSGAGIVFWAPFDDAMNLPKLAFLGFIVAPYLLFQMRNRSNFGRVQNLPNLFKIVLLLISSAILISSMMSQNVYGSLLGHHSRYNGAILYFILILTVYFIQGISFEGMSALFLKYFAYASLVQVGYGFLQLLNLDPIVWNLEFNRIVTTLGNPDFSSAYMGMAGIVYLHLAVSTERTLWKRVFWFAISLLCLILTLTTNAKQGTALMIFGILIYFYFSEALGNKKVAVLSAIAILGGGLMVVLGMFRLGPLESIVYKDSISFRGDYWRAGLKMFINNPIFGVGFSRYGDFFREYRDITQVTKRGAAFTSDQSHSVYIDFFATGGILVGTLFLIFIALVTFFGLKNILGATNKQTRRISAAIFAIWISYLAQAFISIDQITLAIWGWLTAAVISAAYTYERREKILNLQVSGPIRSRNYLLVLIPVYLFSVTALLIPVIRADSPLRDVNALMNRVNESPEVRDFVKLRAVQVANENTRDSYALKQSGIALAMVGEIDSSLNALERAIGANPRDSVANAALGSILRQVGRYQNSLTYFNKAISLDPLNQGIYAELIQSKISLDDLAGAEITLDEMSKIDSRSILYKESANLLKISQSGN